MEVIFLVFFLGTSGVYSHMEPYIVREKHATITQFPHTVLLNFLQNGGFDHHCGSSILNQRILLTSAFCLYRPDDDKWDIVALAGYGSNKKMPILRKINNYLIHPNYNSEKCTNNIGLVHLSKPLIFGPTVKRVIIEPTFGNKVDTVATGWGLMDENNGKYAYTLKFMKQKIQDMYVCKKAYDELPETSISGIFCTLEDIKNHGSQGEFGNALMSSESVQVGITSFRSKHHPELFVYTNVTYYYQWILDSAKILYCTGKPFIYIFSDNTV